MPANRHHPPDPDDPSLPPLERLVAIMARLRDPRRGCPWDLEQDFASIAPYTIEEAYEVADAIQHGDMASLRDELGDLLLQVVFHAQMANEAGAFAIEDVAQAINDKMIKRHPHVFGEASIDGAAAQTQAWETQKAEERLSKATAEGRPGRWMELRSGFPPSPAPSSCRGARPGSASIGRPGVRSPRSRPSSARSLAKSKPRLPPASARPSRMNVAICCSSASICCAIWISTRRPRCGQRTQNSNAASAPSRHECAMRAWLTSPVSASTALKRPGKR